jgi:hypothetical protein
MYILGQDRHTRRSRRRFRNYLAALLLVLSPLAAFAGILPERQTWAFMQSVGGISIGSPYRDGTGFSVPLSCDVSGLKKITVQPAMLNSALAADDVDVVVTDRVIYLTVVTTPVSRNKSPLCKPALLGDLSSGEYQVIYRDPDGTEHELGTILIRK